MALSTDPRLSVIIPTIDEAESLPSLLIQLAQQRDIALEMIIADGGSTDGTPEAGSRMGARVVASDAGRGLQMNQAAAVSRGDFLLFLHADSALTDKQQLAVALASLEQRIEQLGHNRVAGHFRLRFQHRSTEKHNPYHYYEEKSALNRPECTNGDQGFLMQRRFFDDLGGFDQTLWFLEDQRLAETIRLRGEWTTLPGELCTSARRFEQEGLRRRMILSALIMNFHHIGLTEFFRRAGSVYRNQAEAGQLAMTPIFQLVQTLNREAGLQVAARRWLATGRYVRSHSWQIFFYLDVKLQPLLGSGRRPFLRTHDRLLRPVIDLPPFDYLAAGLTYLWFHSSRWLFRRLEKAGPREKTGPRTEVPGPRKNTGSRTEVLGPRKRKR